ncbi:MAG TPA: ABC transporter substrate-binding protein [Xanthobacteraceae bacterium]|jgi:branched-chain amino acid transport system substrate-binding protein|nr:ABC transporter substrate-binding protein [Xanthobacteraceae bacterium]
MNSNHLRIAFVVLASMASGVALAEDGVTDKTIVFGQVAALTGPAQDLGQGMRQGILAAFDEANRGGGIFGRKLELKSRDDGYEPEKTIEATKAILDEDKVFALIGAVGTPTSKVSQPIATQAKVPFIGPFTGAEFLRNPYNRYVVNVRSSYFEETEAWIEHLTKDLGISKIAILYQDDAFGLTGLEGVQRAMAKRNLTLVASGSFRRNTVAVKSALLDIMKAEPEAVVTVAPYKPVAQFIKVAHQVQLNAVFVAISFVGSDSLAKELGKDGAGVIVSQVVPSPWDDSLPVVASYQHALTADDPTAKPGFVSLEGYVVGRLVVDALKRIKGEPTREGLLDAIGSAPFDMGGITLTYGPAKNQGSDHVFFTILQANGTFKPVSRLAKIAGQ